MNTLTRCAGPLLLSLLVFSVAAEGESLTGKDLVTALHSGGYVILMRHASSPRTRPEAAQTDPDNVQHERQLDEAGRASAKAMGDAFRRLQIPIGQVLSSPMYRALETVRLARFGPAKTSPELGDGGNSMRPDTSGQRGTWLRDQVEMQPASGTNTIIVTHLPNIAEAFPKEAKGLEDGEALIFHPDGHGSETLVARVKIDHWSGLASAHKNPPRS